jgi:large subunit ribosomal protein L21
MYAIIEDSGTQFKVTSGDLIRIDRPVEDFQKLLDAREIKFDKVLLIGGGEDGKGNKLGAPLVAGAVITGEVLRTFKGKKVIIEKHNRRKRYHRRKGHRQNYLEVKIGDIA